MRFVLSENLMNSELLRRIMMIIFLKRENFIDIWEEDGLIRQFNNEKML